MVNAGRPAVLVQHKPRRVQRQGEHLVQQHGCGDKGREHRGQVVVAPDRKHGPRIRREPAQAGPQAVSVSRARARRSRVREAFVLRPLRPCLSTPVPLDMTPIGHKCLCRGLTCLSAGSQKDSYAPFDLSAYPARRSRCRAGMEGRRALLAHHSPRLPSYGVVRRNHPRRWKGNRGRQIHDRPGGRLLFAQAGERTADHPVRDQNDGGAGPGCDDRASATGAPAQRHRAGCAVDPL